MPRTLLMLLLLLCTTTSRGDPMVGGPLPLATVDPAAPLTDLAGFGEMVGNARIVALGEATHGTREIFQMKHRLLHYLVEEKGFEIFSIEASMPEAYAIDPYVQGAEGDVEELIAGMYFWTWHTAEVRDMVQWMRAHNQRGIGPRVSFTGFDMQQPYEAAATVWTMAGNVDPGWGRALRRDYRNIRSIADLDEIQVDLDARLPSLRAIYSPAELAWLEQCARVVVQGMTRMPDDEANMYKRDRHMAENVAWIAEQNPGSRIVLWAHNMHVSRAEGWMGAHLADRFGDDYLPVGFALGTGRYQAVDLRKRRRRDGVLQDPPTDSVESLLAAPGYELAVLDLRESGNEFHEVRPMRSIGSVVKREQFEPVNAAELYDLLIYIDRSTPSRELPGRLARPPSL